MDKGQADPRIEVSVGATRLGVTVVVGDITVAITLPAAAGVSDLTAERVRALALGQAGRVLEIAREELR